MDETSEFVNAEGHDGWIEGYAHAAYERQIDPYFRVPLFSHIHGNLWMGGAPADSTNSRCLWTRGGLSRFGAILNVAPFWKYQKPLIIEYREVEMYDSADGLPDVNELTELAHWVSSRAKRMPVLVHCQAGLNRSSLVMAFTLNLAFGMSGEEAMTLIREKRHKLCLCNETFETFVKGLKV